MSKFKIGDRVHYDDRLTKGVGTIRSRAPASEGFDWGVEVAEHDKWRAYHKDNVRWFLACDLIPSLTIEPGKFYRTRNGKVTGRVSKGDTGFEAVVDGRVRIFDAAGGHVHGDAELDIVEVWAPKVGERVRMAREVDGNMSECAATITHDDGPTKLNLVIKFDRAHSWAHTAAGRAPDYYAYWVGASDLDPLPVAAPQQAATLQIEAGKFYRTRDGRKVGPMESDNWGDGYPWTDGERWYSGNGAWIESEESEHGLIAEWHDTPSAPVATLVDAIAEEYGPAPTEPDTTLHIKFTSDFSELDAAILVRKKKLKKLIKLARKAGIDLREAA